MSTKTVLSLPVHQHSEPVVVVGLTSRSGKPRAMWLMTLSDAKRFCSDERTAGRNFMFFFESIAVFTDGSFSFPSNRVRKDNGLMDAVIAELGITLIPLSDASRFRGGGGVV